MQVAYIAAAQADRQKMLSKPEGALLLDSGQTQKWQPPDRGELKLSTDGAFFEASGDGGWGYVIRDGDVRVCSAGAGRSDHLQSAFHAELQGCAEGLKMAVSLGVQKLTLEVDASQVKAAILGDDYRLSAMGGIITEIKIVLSSELAGSRINLCPRSCNGVAHALAAIGCNLPSGVKYAWDDVPQELEALVSSELAVTAE